MGRKIPAKKHRGVKDPIKQQEQRFQSIKHKINAPPADPDEQPVPRSLQRLFAFQQPRAPADNKPKRPRKANGSRNDSNPVAALKRLPGESGRAFSRRISGAVRALHDPGDHDYPMDLEDTDTRGEYIAAQRERRQRKTRAAQARAARGAGEGGAAGGGAPSGGGGAPAGGGAGDAQERLRKAQRRALKKKEIMKAKEADIAASRALAARELQFERVSFGDVAHAPPALPAPRRAAAAPGAPRPGRRDLLLSSLLGAGGARGAPPAPLPAATSAAERARLQAVEAYRALRREQARARQR